MNICLKCKKNEETETLRRCSHVICYKCLCDHLQNLRSAKVKCPIESCNKLISDGIIRKCLSNYQTEIYDKLCFSPNAVKCVIKECPFIISSDDKEGHFICDICKQPNCLRCKRIHDIDLSCNTIQNYQIEQFEEAAHPSIRMIRNRNFLNDFDSDDLLPNDKAFECSICSNFILPRIGVSLRNCMDMFCRPCFTEYVKSVDNINTFNCPNYDCNRPLTEREFVNIIGNEKYQQFNIEALKTIMYNCQTAECKGIWDFGDFTGQHKCQCCGKMNCAVCEDIHEGQTCQLFQTTTRFIQTQKFKKGLTHRQSITCQKCNAMIIKNKGCNALRCPKCRLQVCAFSGQEIGPEGCQCTNSKRCAVDCAPGCIPEGNTPYEQRLAEYFWNN